MLTEVQPSQCNSKRRVTGELLAYLRLLTVMSFTLQVAKCKEAHFYSLSGAPLFSPYPSSTRRDICDS